MAYAGYDRSTPQGPFRRWRMNVNGWTGTTWGGERTGLGGNVNGNAQLANFWSVYSGVNYNAERLSTVQLRGGPAIVTEGQWNGWGGLHTDSRKSLRFGLNTWWNARPESDSWTVDVSPNVGWRPSGRADVSLGLSWRRSVDDRQWVDAVEASDGDHRLFGRMSQTTVGLTARVDYAFTPGLSLQLYAQPFVSAGEFRDFAEVADPRAERYADRFRDRTVRAVGDEYLLDLDGDGVDESFSDPAFNVRQFRSNAVLRWEYRPGSTLYVVWAQNRDHSAGDGSFDLGSDVDRLFSVRPDNVFMVKVSYWLNP